MFGNDIANGGAGGAAFGDGETDQHRWAHYHDPLQRQLAQTGDRSWPISALTGGNSSASPVAPGIPHSMTTQQNTDRRRWPRYSVLVACRIEGISTRTSVRLTELSIGGGYVDANTRLHAGASITVIMDLDGTEVTVPARVVYALGRTGFGFAFDMNDLSKEAQKELEQFLRRRETGL